MRDRQVKFNTLVDLNLEIGESPVWDEQRGAVWFVDILSPAVLCIELATRKLSAFAMPAMIGSVSLASDARLVVALRTGVHLFDPQSGQLEFLVHPEPDRAENRLNDGKIGPDGCFWIGSMHDSVPRSPTGALYRVTPRGESVRVLDGIKVSNGLAWSPDGRTMYHSDSTEARVTVFDFDPATGRVGNARTLLTLSEEQGLPDGAAMDVDGFYWSAGVSSGRLNRISPQGDVIESIALPVSAPTMPCFGDFDGRTVFVTSLASTRSGRWERGRLISFRTDAVGAPIGRFGQKAPSSAFG